MDSLGVEASEDSEHESEFFLDLDMYLKYMAHRGSVLL
jgi:hypothetical protein